MSSATGHGVWNIPNAGDASQELVDLTCFSRIYSIIISR